MRKNILGDDCRGFDSAVSNAYYPPIHAHRQPRRSRLRTFMVHGVHRWARSMHSAQLHCRNVILCRFLTSDNGDRAFWIVPLRVFVTDKPVRLLAQRAAFGTNSTDKNHRLKKETHKLKMRHQRNHIASEIVPTNQHIFDAIWKTPNVMA